MTSQEDKQQPTNSAPKSKNHFYKMGIALWSLLGLIVGGGGVFAFYEYKITGELEAIENIRKLKIDNAIAKNKSTLETFAIDKDILQGQMSFSGLNEEERESLRKQIITVEKSIQSHLKSFRLTIQEQLGNNTGVNNLNRPNLIKEIRDLETFLANSELTQEEHRTLEYSIVTYKWRIYCFDINNEQKPVKNMNYANAYYVYKQSILRRYIKQLSFIERKLLLDKLGEEEIEVLSRQQKALIQNSVNLLQVHDGLSICEVDPVAFTNA